MNLQLITAPAEVPISLAEAKAIARLDGIDDTDDAVIAGFIMVATDWVEHQLGKALISQTWAYSIDSFPHGYYPQLRLPIGPAQSITEVLYVDNAGVPQVLDPAAYVLAGDSLWPSYGTTWPTARAQPAGVVITYTAGFGADWNAVPEAIRQGIAMLVQGMYDGCSNDGAALEMMRPYKSWAF